MALRVVGRRFFSIVSDYKTDDRVKHGLLLAGVGATAGTFYGSGQVHRMYTSGRPYTNGEYAGALLIPPLKAAAFGGLVGAGPEVMLVALGGFILYCIGYNERR